MKNIFNSIEATRPKSNLFDLSYESKFSTNMAKLIPFYVQDVIPSDKFQVSSEILMRLAPMTSAVMARVSVYTHYFFVPNRLLWDEWEDFITGGPDGTLEPPFPQITMQIDKMAWYAKGTVADFMGVPSPDPTTAYTQKISCLPFRAYNLIYNEYYRDQNLTEPIAITKSTTVSTEETTLLSQMRYRAWEKDYFTSALPFSQRGGEVGIPVDFQYKTRSNVVDSFTGNAPAVDGDMVAVVEDGIGYTNTTNTQIRVENLEEEGVSVTINEFRKAHRLQTWLEKNARGGARYVEQILAHFGVRSSDARLQRPEYLGGAKQNIIISEVLNSTSNADESGQTTLQPVGQINGHGISVGKSNGFSKSFEEHGYVIGIMSVMPRSSYQQGFEKHLLKTDKFEYAWPEFANLGEQPILYKELYMNWQDSQYNDQTFGYTPRYAEYKFRNSQVHGDFRDNLSNWTMARIFTDQPHLNTDFVEGKDVTHRIFAVTDDTIDKLYCHVYHKVYARRPLPVFGTPTL